MTSERIQRRIDALLDEADQAMARLEWSTVRDRASAVLAADPENADGRAYLEMAERGLGTVTAVAGGASPAIPPASDTPQPTSFANGRYVVKRFLGEGGKKKVYLAHDASLDRDVAFALIKTEGLDEVGKERVTREAQAMGRLGEHPNNVSVYDIGEESRQPYVVLPLMPGGDVEGEIENAPEHKLPLERVLQIAIDTCQGLAFAHERGILHRDIKPGNVWLATDGRAQVGDWGLAVASDRTRLTQAGMMVGTPTYMPPEQAMGGEITARSDLYSLGAMLYEMVCGRPPFVGDESVAIIGQHLNTPPVAPTWHRPDCPPALEALILRLLEKDPAKRPQSAAEVRDALQSISQPSRGRTQTKAEPVTSPDDHDPLYRRTFVGRENEVRQLQQSFDAAMSGNGALVMVVGEPGIGKTALCEQLATYVALRGGKALVGHCYEEGSLSLPYLAFVEAMRSYVLERDPEGLRSDLGTGAADVARIVSEIRDRVAVELRPSGDAEDDRWRLLQAVTGFLRNASTVQPLAIVLEDLHWADRGTLDLLLHVARNLQGARLLVIGTYRDVEVDRAHPLSAVLGDLRRVGSLPRVLLRGLTVDEVQRMYSAIRGHEVAWTAAEAVFRQTEGNPLFVQEIARYMVEEGMVVREGGRYVPQVGPGFALPDGLRDVVGRRLSHLGEKTNAVLSAASVNGRDFRLDILQRVTGFPEEQVIEALQEAKQRAIIEDQPAAGAICFRFTHALFRQTLYEEIFTPRRIRLHQQVGRALEEVHARRLDEHAAELAEHFAQSTEAADLEKAVRYSQLAADRALNVYAHGEAARHLRQALRAQEVLDPDDRESRSAIQLRLAEALGPAGELDDIEQLAEEAYQLSLELGNPVRASRACQAAMYGLFRRGPQRQEGPVYVSAGWRNWARRADACAPEGTADRAQADIAMALAFVDEADPREAMRLFHRAMALGRQLGDNQAAFRSAIFLMQVEDPRESLKIAEAFLDAPRHGVNAVTLSGVLGALAMVFLNHGDRQRCEGMLAEIHALRERTHEPITFAHSLQIESRLRFAEGELEAVLAAAEEWQNTSRAVGFAAESDWLSAAQPQIARFYLKGESLAAENPTAETIIALLGVEEPSPVPSSFVRNTLFQHMAGIRSLRVMRALRVGDDYPGIIPADTAVSLLQAAVTLRAKQVLPRIVSLAEPFAELTMTIGYPVCPARLLGEASALLGKPDQARAYYARALEVCEKVRFRPEIALIRLDLAELLLEHSPDEHDAAIEHLDYAISEFREMKMQPSLERALRHRGLLKA